MLGGEITRELRERMKQRWVAGLADCVYVQLMTRLVREGLYQYVAYGDQKHHCFCT